MTCHSGGYKPAGRGPLADWSKEITSAAYFNPLALELDIYSLAHHLCKM